MIGIIIFAIVILGIRGGFTGITYPLTLFALGLCAFGVISPFFLIAFVPLAAAQHARMQHPLLTPPFLGRSGLLPVFGFLGVIFTVTTVIRIF